MSRFLRTLAGESLSPPPVWLMRQAGRYLPEYRAIRAQAPDFLAFCFDPDLATEVPLQPIRRFGLDAAILFSDILVLPHALGQSVWFEEGVGPRLEPLRSEADLLRLSVDGVSETLDPCCETLRRLRKALPDEVGLIGFAGAPWTVASYMIEGGSSRDFTRAKRWAFAAPESFGRLIDLIVAGTVRYLLDQVAAGAQVLQLFDSWSGVWAEPAFRQWCSAPAAAIAQQVRQRHPDVPLIYFPRAAGGMLPEAAGAADWGALGLDTTVPLAWARSSLPSTLPLQGNLDPQVLVVGGSALEAEVRRIRSAMTGRPFVFNLGHGIDKDTPPENVSQLVELVREQT